MLKENLLTQVDYKQIIEGLSGAIYLCDNLGRISFYNEAASQLWGRKPEIGKDLWCGSWKIYKTDGTILPLKECPMAITLKKGYAVTGKEIIIERPDGTRLNILPHPKPLFDKNGNIIGAINMLVDITARRTNENKLKESEKKYKALAKTLQKKVTEKTFNLIHSEDRYRKMIDEVEDYAILQLDEKGIVLNWNKGAEKIKGYKEEEIVGKSFNKFYLPEDKEDKLPERLLNQAKLYGRATHEGWRVKKNGTKFWGSVVITSLHDDANKIIGFTKVTRDLTDKKIAEEQLKQYAKDLEIRNKELEQFAYVASHDLQEPLRKIQTFAHLLEQDIKDEKATNIKINKIKSAALRMSNLIKDILKFSKLTQIEEAFVELDLNKVIENIKEDFELLITQKQAVIIHPNLPIIKAVPIQIHQLFSNLIDNAIKFNTSNPIINISYNKFKMDDNKLYPQLDPDVNYYKFIVKDNGIGFNPIFTDKIFKLFQRLDVNSNGSGIGLALCQKIVERHKGIISVDSAEGKGSSFTIILPA
ncbi:MAG TPA: PAS domain S-box protein [Saprospiraceae bacterium]|nr:PAS domain S-box protein [Saprospiraceae bacterium]